jgi:HSP20 family protein
MSKAKSTQETSQRSTEKGQEQKEAAGRTPQTGQSQARQGTNLARRERYGLSPLAQSSPFSFMRRFGEEMDRLFDDFGFGSLGPSFARDLARSGFASLGQSVWSPQVEMFEREGKLVVRADLPGLTKDDVKVDLEDDSITIQGDRRSEHEENREGYVRSERSYGSFYRTIPLPEGVNGEDAKATFRDGVLEIVMEAPKRKKGRRIDIEEAPKSK